MANAPSRFEQMIMNNGPVQTSIMRNLTRWEFRNLQLAGVRFSGNRLLLRKYLIPDRCNEWEPQISLLWKSERCLNTSKSFDGVRACSGCPVSISEESLVMGKGIGGEEIEKCVREVHWWDDEVNAERYPIHKKVCSRCRQYYAAANLADQLQRIAQFRTPLCKQHSLEHSNQFPSDACCCFGFVNHKWRCTSCYASTLNYLSTRAHVFSRALREKKIPWSHPWEYLRSFWTSRDSGARSKDALKKLGLMDPESTCNFVWDATQSAGPELFPLQSRF